MAKARKREKAKGKNKALVVICAAAAILLVVFAAAIHFHWFSCVSGCSEPVSEPSKPLPKPKSGQLSVYFFDVEQGDAALLISPSGKTMLIDSGEAVYGDLLLAWLEELGVKQLDLAVGTHPHFDHVGAMPQVLSAVKTKEYLMPEITFDTLAQPFVDAALLKNRIPKRYVYSGDTIEWDENCTLTVLSPVLGCEYSSTDANDYSLILRVEYGNTSYIFEADATVHAEQLSMYHNDKQLFQADVLKVAHHGSTTSSSYGFLETVSPKYAIISVGADNTYGHPDFDILNRLSSVGAAVLRTDRLGTIAVFSDGDKVYTESCP